MNSIIKTSTDEGNPKIDKNQSRTVWARLKTMTDIGIEKAVQDDTETPPLETEVEPNKDLTKKQKGCEAIALCIMRVSMGQV